ncbi:phage tail protein [Photobacterium damselae]
MHHLVIGEFVFSVGGKTPITKFERTSPGAFAEVGLIYDARSENVGRPLETIDISAKWLQFGAYLAVEQLRTLIETPQQVSDGQGMNLGKWTIGQLKEGKSSLIHNGKAMVTDITLQLKEYRE